MLKQAASGVLAARRGLHVPQRYAEPSALAAALLDGLFEHPLGQSARCRGLTELAMLEWGH